jgi:hypothetical protein
MKKILSKVELKFGSDSIIDGNHLSIDINLFEITLTDDSIVYNVGINFLSSQTIKSLLKLEDYSCTDMKEAFKRFRQLHTSLKVLFENMEIER